MSNKKQLGKTAPAIGRSGIYYSAGDNRPFSVGEMDNNDRPLGNTYTAGFQYFNSNTNEYKTDEFHNIDQRENSDNFENDQRTMQPKATRATNRDISSSTQHKESKYYTSECSSISDSTSQPEEMPTWRKLLQDPEKARYYLNREWPKVCRLTYILLTVW